MFEVQVKRTAMKLGVSVFAAVLMASAAYAQEELSLNPEDPAIEVGGETGVDEGYVPEEGLFVVDPICNECNPDWTGTIDIVVEEEVGGDPTTEGEYEGGGIEIDDHICLSCGGPDVLPTDDTGEEPVVTDDGVIAEESVCGGCELQSVAGGFETAQVQDAVQPEAGDGGVFEHEPQLCAQAGATSLSCSAHGRRRDE